MCVLQDPLVSLECFKTGSLCYIKRTKFVVEEILSNILWLPLFLDFLDVRLIGAILAFNKDAILHVGAHSFFFLFINMDGLDCSALLRCTESKVDDWRVDGQHAHWGVFSIKLHRQESGLPLHALIYLEQTRLHRFKFCRGLVYLCFHQFGWICEFQKVLLGWLCVEKFYLQEKLSFKECIWFFWVRHIIGISFFVKLFAVNFRSEFYYVPQVYGLFGVSDEESLCNEGSIIVEYFWLNKFVERHFLGVIWVGSWLMVVRISVVDFVLILIVYLELYKVNSLLEEVNISEVLQMQNELCSRSVTHLLAKLLIIII